MSSSEISAPPPEGAPLPPYESSAGAAWFSMSSAAERDAVPPPPAAGIARFGIAAQTADENNFVNGHETILPPRRTCCGQRSLVAMLLGMTILFGSSLY